MKRNSSNNVVIVLWSIMHCLPLTVIYIGDLFYIELYICFKCLFNQKTPTTTFHLVDSKQLWWTQNSPDRLKICGELTIIDGGLLSSAVGCGGLKSPEDIGRTRPNENGTFVIIMSSLMYFNLPFQLIHGRSIKNQWPKVALGGIVVL